MKNVLRGIEELENNRAFDSAKVENDVIIPFGQALKGIKDNGEK